LGVGCVDNLFLKCVLTRVFDHREVINLKKYFLKVKEMKKKLAAVVSFIFLLWCQTGIILQRWNSFQLFRLSRRGSWPFCCLFFLFRPRTNEKRPRNVFRKGHEMNFTPSAAFSSSFLFFLTLLTNSVFCSFEWSGFLSRSRSGPKAKPAPSCRCRWGRGGRWRRWRLAIVGRPFLLCLIEIFWSNEKI